MKKIVFICIFNLSLTVQAFNNGGFWGGIGYYSENAINKTSQNPDASSGLLGASSFPVVFKYDYAAFKNWFLAPQLSYTLLPREAAGKSAEITNMHFIIQIGQNAAQGFDWSFGPGILSQTIKGKGGTVTLNNGTSTSTFAQPGRSAKIQKVTLNLGTSYTTGKWRTGFDIFVIAPFSSRERTQNLMLSVSYLFSGSGGSSSSSSGVPFL